MDPNESQHHHHHHPHPHLLSSYFATPTSTAPTTANPSPTNGLLPPSNTATTTPTAATSTTNNNSNNTSTDTGTGGVPILYPHSVGPSSAAVTSAPVEHPPRRNRGRPRKYGTPEQALAAKKTAAASNSASKDKRNAAAFSSSHSASSKRSQQLLALGNAGQGFSPHVISVTAGEDVGQKLMMFMQQSKRDMCILSASGSISNASLRQPAMSGGNIAYEGRFEIISLSGSYVRTDVGGRTGGLSVCLSNTDGQIIGGGVGGPLKAAGPVQVIVGTFLLDNKKKDTTVSVKGDNSVGKLPSLVGGSSISSIGFRSPVESSGRNLVRGNDDLQTIAGNQYAVQHRGMQATPPQHDWRIGADAFSVQVHQSPENGDYEQFPE